MPETKPFVDPAGLRVRRTSRGWTLHDLSDEIALHDRDLDRTATTLSRYETGSRSVPPKMARALAHIYRCSVRQLGTVPRVRVEER